MVADATEAETDDFATRGTQSRPRSRIPVYGDKTHYTQHHVLVLKNGELVVNMMRNPRAMANVPSTCDATSIEIFSESLLPKDSKKNSLALK